jgi:GcrA cell cycle regulator
MNIPGGNNPSGGKTWTDERLERMKRLWSAGHSAAHIAEQLGGGISRNAVIGAARRAGCERRPSPVKHSGQPRERKADGTKVGPNPERTQPAANITRERVPAVPVRDVDLEPPQIRVPFDGTPQTLAAVLASGGCKWAVTGHHVRPDQHRFCGAPRSAGSPYCDLHREKAKGKPAQDPGNLASIDNGEKAA